METYSEIFRKRSLKIIGIGLLVITTGIVGIFFFQYGRHVRGLLDKPVTIPLGEVRNMDSATTTHEKNYRPLFLTEIIKDESIAESESAPSFGRVKEEDSIWVLFTIRQQFILYNKKTYHMVVLEK